jgi:hypothetical protein
MASHPQRHPSYSRCADEQSYVPHDGHPKAVKPRAKIAVVEYEDQIRIMNLVINQGASAVMECVAHMTSAERRFYEAFLALMDRHADR